MTVKTLAALLAAVLPQVLKRWIYRVVFRWQIDSTATIGINFILVENLVIERGASISHFNVIKGCRLVHLKPWARIGAFNWISSSAERLVAYGNSGERDPSLVLGSEASITNRHLIDCGDRVTLHDFAKLAGHRSQVLTHSFDIAVDDAKTAPVSIGERSIVFTGAILLPGSNIPARSVVAAGAVVAGDLQTELHLYGGVPAKPIKAISASSRYFSREYGIDRAANAAMNGRAQRANPPP